LDTPVSGTPRRVLQLEALAVLAAAVLGYRALGASWLLFALALLVPDVSIAGYMAGPRIGAGVYNAVHSYLAPAVVACLAFITNSPAAWAICLIWTAHIGMDRALGLGLKFASGFRDTHLGTVGGATAVS
jgi:Domain of unknown function (DUF4260)